MEQSDDTNSDSFEVLPNQSLPQSLSIITIPDEQANGNTYIPLPSSSTTSHVSPIHEMETTQVASMDINQLEHQEMKDKLTNFERQMLQQTHVKSLAFNKDLQMFDAKGDDMTEPDSIIKAMDTLLKELSDIREENGKLRTAIIYNNNTMKSQLERLQESQLQMHNNKKEHENEMTEANAMIEKLKNENSMLKNESSTLNERIKEFESNAGLKWMDDLGFEVASLRSRVDQYDKFDTIKEQMLLKNKELTAQLSVAHDEISKKTSKVIELESQLKLASEDLETVPVLKQQIEIYERDFKIEEMAKSAALKENEKFEEEIRQLKDDKAQLEEELRKERPVTSTSLESGCSKSYSCPKCWFSFTKLQAAQNHIERCVVEDGLFT